MIAESLFPNWPPQEPTVFSLALSLTYAGQPIRMVGTAEQPEWVAADVGRVLSLGNVRSSLAALEADEKGVQRLDTVGRGQQSLTTVTEAGLYRLIFRSDKPEARAFQRWVMHEVLPSIRRHGCYPPPLAMEPVIRPLAIGESISPGTTLIPLSAVPLVPWLPRKPAVATVYSWHRFGRRGIHLETVRVVGRLYTTEAALLIFFTRLASPNPRSTDAPVSITLNADSFHGRTMLNALSALPDASLPA